MSEAPSDRNANMATRPRILIVEDHPLVREAIESRIAQALPDYEIVYSGGSVKDVLELVKATPADCVILDLDLGDGTSPIANTALLVTANLRVLVVSALADPATVRATLRVGALGFVSKAAPIDEFTASLHSVLAGEPYTSRDVAGMLYSDTSVSVALSERERTAMVLYSSGLKMETVARRMGVKTSTAQEYIKRVREKYMKSGTPLPSKTDLYRQAREEGLVP